MNKNFNKALLVASLVGLSTSASASIIYNYERGAGTFGGNSGLSYDSVSASFDTGSNDFSFSVDYNGAAADGGWLVVSPGANPKNSSEELGIAYLDADTGDVWVYAYNGQNNNQSYQQTSLIEYFSDAYITDGDVATVSFDATLINATLETGFAFGNDIGIWFHPSSTVITSGGEDGLSNFLASGNGWLDTSFDGNCDNPNNGCITTVPEPSSLALVGLGLGLMGLRRRLL